MSSPRLLSNRYEIDDTLGYGGMSEVHRGRDVRLGRDVAVKVLRADLARDPTFELRFRREAQNAAALNHPAIVAVYDTGETDSENGPLPYIVMEYVDGRTLRDIVKTEGPLAPRRTMEVMADASAALDFSHRHGIVHRDVKPANIMITRSGAVKVMDFGIARAVADGQPAVTQTAAVIGTAQYLSPEQARGESVDARSDVYASGCVIFELLTGEPPFTGDSPVAVAYQHVREDPRTPSELNEQVPASLDAVVLKALSKNPANRYQSAADMRADLVRVLSGQRPKAPMIMSEEERTSMLTGPATSTEVIAPSQRTEATPEPDEELDGQKRKSRKGWIVTLVALLCLGLLTLAGLLGRNMLSNAPADDLVALPDLRGKQIVEAEAMARAQNLPFFRQNCSSPPDKVGIVVDQRPAPPERARKGQRIMLCSGSGPATVQVPELSGKSLPEARQLLESRGLKLTEPTKTRPVEDPNDINKVLSQEPSGAVPEGTTITVTVGTEIPKFPVPDVRGSLYDQARKIVESSGFKVERRVVDAPQPKDSVIAQTPPGGSPAPRASTVTLTVSKGQEQVMPSLKNRSASEAQAILRGMGLQATVVQQPVNDFQQDGKVVNTSPPAGAKVTKEQPVTLYVGKFDLSPPSSEPPTSGLDNPFDW